MQEDALRKAGVERLFMEKASGANGERPQLTAALDQLRPGDVFIVNLANAYVQRAVSEEPMLERLTATS